MPLLATEAFDVGDAHALDAQFLQGALHILQLERLNDGFDLLHETYSL